MTQLIIMRHGNTFGPDDTPTYVGANTDLPLVESGKDQARNCGMWLHAKRIVPEIVYASCLRRTIETAEIATAQLGLNLPVHSDPIFDEIDYGPDENKSKEEVVARIGKQALKDWDEHGTVPEGWNVNPNDIIHNWQRFAVHIFTQEQKTVLVCTSNGIARFAPSLTGDYELFKKNYDIKMATGAISILSFENDRWSVKEWNVKPNFAAGF